MSVKSTHHPHSSHSENIHKAADVANVDIPFLNPSRSLVRLPATLRRPQNSMQTDTSSGHQLKCTLQFSLKGLTKRTCSFVPRFCVYASVSGQENCRRNRRMRIDANANAMHH